MSDIETIIDDDDWIEDGPEVDEFGIAIDEKVAELLDSVTNEISADIDTEDDSTALEETSPKKKKRTKKIIDPFINLNKKYFSTINSRTSKYAIFNLNMSFTDKLVMVSSKKKSTFDDYMYQYMPGDLSIQIIEFKNNDLNEIKEKLKIPDNVCTLVNLAALRKYINVAMRHQDISILPLNTARTEDNNLYLKVTDPKTEVTFIERYGFEFNNWRVIVLLTGLVDSMINFNQIGAVTEKVTYSDLTVYVDQNLVVYPILTSRYIDSEGKPIFNYLVDTHKTKLYLIDGKDIVCVKEFLKKLKPDFEYSLIIQSYVSLPDKCILYKTKYEDADNIIISSRPYVSVFPICTSSKEFKQ